MANTEVWYANVIYNRYWKHYQYAMGWMRRHRTAYWKAKAKADEYENRALVHYIRYLHATNYPSNDPLAFEHNYHQHQLPDMSHMGQPTNKWYELDDKEESRIKHGVKQTSEKKSQHVQQRHDEVQFEMEITEEMLAFLDKSDQHRKELKAKREAEERQEMMDRQNSDECAAPKEQKGAKRTAEMKLLYGKHAAKIHGMETAMQLTFNRNCDYHQPKHWPNIPLNL